MADEVRLHHEGALAIVTVDRPRAKNAIDLAAMDTLERLIDELEASPSVAAAIFTGAGDHFVSGGDLRDLSRLLTSGEGRAMGLKMQAVLTRWARLPCPTLAALDGDAYGGGCEIALACDHRVVSADARFVFKQAAMGLTPGWGGGQRLLRLVGPSRALAWLSTARAVTAEEALAAGLADERAPPGQTALDAARAWGQRIAQQPRGAVRAIKQALVRGAEMPLRAAIDYEAELFAQAWGSGEHRAALQAFFDRK